MTLKISDTAVIKTRRSSVLPYKSRFGDVLDEETFDKHPDFYLDKALIEQLFFRMFNYLD